VRPVPGAGGSSVVPLLRAVPRQGRLRRARRERALPAPRGWGAVRADGVARAHVLRARLGIDVDRDGLGVELDRGAPLLVRPETAGLDPAEWHVHLGAGGL